MDGLADLLAKCGIRVRRTHYPEGEDNLAGLGKGKGILVFVRDPILVMGHNIVELTLTEACRFRERFAVRPVLMELAHGAGATWVATCRHQLPAFPRPRRGWGAATSY